MNQEFRLKKKKKNEIRNYLIEEINQDELTSKNHKKVYRVLNCIEHERFAISTISGWVSISAFASFVISIGIMSSAIELKICVITAEIKRYVSKKKKKKHDRIVLLAKSKLNSMEVLISKVLIDSNISHDEFVFINNEGFLYERRNQKF